MPESCHLQGPDQRLKSSVQRLAMPLVQASEEATAPILQGWYDASQCTRYSEVGPESPRHQNVQVARILCVARAHGLAPTYVRDLATSYLHSAATRTLHRTALVAGIPGQSAQQGPYPRASLAHSCHRTLSLHAFQGSWQLAPRTPDPPQQMTKQRHIF